MNPEPVGSNLGNPLFHSRAILSSLIAALELRDSVRAAAIYARLAILHSKDTVAPLLLPFGLQILEQYYGSADAVPFDVLKAFYGGLLSLKKCSSEVMYDRVRSCAKFFLRAGTDRDEVTALLRTKLNPDQRKLLERELNSL